jgi:protein-S-isoprenylcysteine O-methyltransferase Ste14
MQRTCASAIALHWIFKAATASYFLYLAVSMLRLSPLSRMDSALAISYILLAVAILWRPFAAEVRSDWKAIILCSASSLCYFLLDLDQPLRMSNVTTGEILFSIGTVGWVASALFLNRSFGILPAVREIRRGGPYRWIRHPMYASYLLMDLGLILCFPSLRNIAVVLLAALLYAARALMEEDTLAKEPSYQAYREHTRFRFVPFWF